MTIFKKLVILLLSVNIVTTLSVGYTVYKNLPEEGKQYKIEVENPQNKKFEENAYKGMSMLMQGQSQLTLNQQQLSLAMLRVHHFVKPHDEFMEGCPECELEKQEILSEEQDSITSTISE
tara:strand:- start:5601 stop:5960 length:360 start_codon:yes stop_codon:yes gene_type:complete